MCTNDLLPLVILVHNHVSLYIVLLVLLCSGESAVLNEDEIGLYWVPLGLILRLKPDGKVEAIDVHDDVSVCVCK